MSALKACNKDISNIIIAISFNCGRLIEVDDSISWWNFSYCPLQIWALKTCNQDISKIIIVRSFKLRLTIAL